MAVPAAPANLAAESSVSGTLVTWDASAGATGYYVQRRMAPGGVGTGTFLTFANTTSLSNADTHAVDTLGYEYRALAYNADGVSDPSNADYALGQVPGASDGFDPSITSATVNTAGTTLTLVFSEWVYGVFPSEFTLSGGHALSDPSPVSGTTFTMTVTPRVELGETLTLDYTGTSFRDSDGTPADTFADFAVTNNSAQTGSESPTTYGTRAGIEGIYGTTNVTDYADVNDNQDAADILGQIDRARAASYREINLKLARAELTVPATEDDFDQFGILADVENELAGVWLYYKRGKNDNDPNGPAQMDWHRTHALSLLDEAIGVEVDEDDDVAGDGEFQFIPIRRTTPSDENAE